MIMLPRPIRRSAVSSISAIDATSDRQRPGYKKGIIPSITSTKLIAMPKSRHIILQAALFRQAACQVFEKLTVWADDEHIAAVTEGFNVSI